MERRHVCIDADTVDLRHLDPNKPIVVDPNIAQGKERRFPVQVSDKTLANRNYTKGFDQIRAGDPSAAVRSFEQAKRELGDDPLVRNALELARELAQLHAAKAAKSLANKEAYEAIRAALGEEYIVAEQAITRAIKLEPRSERFRQTQAWIRERRETAALRLHLEDKAAERADKDRRVHALGASTLAAIQRRDYDSAISALERMLALENISPTRELLDAVREWRAQALVKRGKRQAN